MAVTVVIVDDEAIIRDGLRARVRNLGADFVVTADFGSGEQALEWLKQSGADLLLLDVRMPKMDGLSLLREVRALGMDTYAIIISGYRDFDYVREAMRCGASDYLLKPIDPAEFERVMQTARKSRGGEVCAESGRAELMEYVCEYIQKAMREDLSLVQVARHFGYHPAYLSRLIKNHTGMGYSSYLTHARIECAMKLLSEKGMSVTDVAMALGFNDLAYFCRVFKRSTGVTPQRYREGHSR